MICPWNDSLWGSPHSKSSVIHVGPKRETSFFACAMCEWCEELGDIMSNERNESNPATETGFEGKSLRVIIENWLYTGDEATRVAAALELRKFFRRTFQCPEWAKSTYNKDSV